MQWLVSGFLHMLPASQRAEARRMPVDLSLQRPSLPFRNPEKLEQAWRLQRDERAQGIAFFGSDLVVLPGHDVADRIQAFHPGGYLDLAATAAAAGRGGSATRK